MTSSPPNGLRERKKARTRAAIRQHAFRLFEEQGYAATTVDQIAEAADVSPSTFFRYFPAKEDLVVDDDYDPVLVAEVRAQPAGVPPIPALRTAIRTVYERLGPDDWEQERRRQRLFASVPELRNRSMQQYAVTIDVLAEVIAERAGLAADDFSARVMAGAVVGAVMAVTRSGVDGEFTTAGLARMDEALALLDAGLPLTPGTPVSGG